MKAKKDTVLRALQKEYKGKEQECQRCKKVREITVDHVIPKHFLEQLGLFDEALNWIDNFELLCLACNRFKGGQLDLANSKTIPLLKEAVRRAEAVDNQQKEE